MEKLVIKKAGRSYSSSESSSVAIDYLGGFLCYDVGSDSESWKQWISDPKTLMLAATIAILKNITIKYS